jgi:hypothetical protein
MVMQSSAWQAVTRRFRRESLARPPFNGYSPDPPRPTPDTAIRPTSCLLSPTSYPVPVATLPSPGAPARRRRAAFQESALEMIRAQGGIFGWTAPSAKLLPELGWHAAPSET